MCESFQLQLSESLPNKRTSSTSSRDVPVQNNLGHTRGNRRRVLQGPFWGSMWSLQRQRRQSGRGRVRAVRVIKCQRLKKSKEWTSDVLQFSKLWEKWRGKRLEVRVHLFQGRKKNETFWQRQRRSLRWMKKVKRVDDYYKIRLLKKKNKQ